MALYRVPKIVWNANTLNIGWPMDMVAAYSMPRAGSRWALAPSGVRDAWIVDDEQVLAGRVRWIPTDDITVPVTATGWDGATGWRAFLEWARDMNTFSWYPDKDSGTNISCYLMAPLNGELDIERDGTRTIRLVLVSSDGTAFTGY